MLSASVQLCHLVISYSYIIYEPTFWGEDISVERICERSDLGVLFTPNLELHFQLHHIVQKANSDLLPSLKNFWMHLCHELCTQVWFVLFWIIHVHACVVWCPLQLGDMRAIEKLNLRQLQRDTTKIVPALKDNKSYHDCLVLLNLPIVCCMGGECMDMIAT